MVNEIRNNLILCCIQKLKDLGLNNDLYRDRLKKECSQLEKQMEFQYIYDLFASSSKFEKNDPNLLVYYLLGIADDFDINQSFKLIEDNQPPDIDIDYQKEAKSYLTNEWAQKQFGEEKVCSICNYTTFGIKSAILDMAKTFSKDKAEVQKLTKNLDDKDDEGKPMTWDKALELSPDLANYCKANPEVFQAARKFLHRKRGLGKHAGGLIISGVRIDDIVPLVVSKEGVVVSAFTEGQHDTDLSPLGLVKFDVLGVNCLTQISECCRLVKERHGLQAICAVPEGENWSDISYLNDPDVLALANKAKTKGIFQFDSQGMQKLILEGGVTSFDDLPAYSSLYRPGPMGTGMHETYVKRKKGLESYETNPILNKILGNTYYVMVYQEQVMRILRDIGAVPDMHCEIVRKAISKKKTNIIARYKEQFIHNGQKILDYSEEKMNELWEQVEAFSGYGFNKSHAYSYGYISARGLWLKAHYPQEFFCALLSTEGEYDKIKEYKREAEAFGMKVNPVSLNRSNTSFSIVNDEIYFGFQKLKGIGEVPAQKIVDNQPYSSIQDFFEKFGLDASVVKPLVALNCFGEEYSRREYFGYYEYYKKYKKSTRKDKGPPLAIEDFVKTFTGEIQDKKFVYVLEGPLFVAESLFYGFVLHHPLETSPDFEEGFTFKDFENRIEQESIVPICSVTVHIVAKPKEFVVKGGKLKYYRVDVEDSNCRKEVVHFWEDDYDRFREELEYWEDDIYKGHFLKMRLKYPDEGYSNFAFDSYSRREKWKRPKTKENDNRLLVLTRGKKDGNS